MKQQMKLLARVQRLQRQAGFSLAATMIALGVLGAVGVGGAYIYKDYKQDQATESRGRQIGTALTHLKQFAVKYQSQLAARQPVAGVADTARPTTAELSQLGFAAASFSDASQPGGAITYRMWVEPTGCAPEKCVIGMAAITSGSVLNAGNVDLALAQRIAGYVPEGAGWSNVPTDATLLVKRGMVISNPLGNVPAVVAAMSWLGSNSASQTVPAVYYEYQTVGCPSGYTGNQQQRRQMTTDKWGSVSAGAWSTYQDNCVVIPPPPPPTCSNGATDYPTCTPPHCTNGASDYPTCTPPTCSNGASDYPTCTPPHCSNGASDYPTCTPPHCTNGASDYPTCTPPTCANGGTDYPTCTQPWVPPPVTPPPPPPPPVCTSTTKWSIPTGSGTHKCSQTTTTCCDGVCHSQVEYGLSYGYTGLCELN